MIARLAALLLAVRARFATGGSEAQLRAFAEELDRASRSDPDRPTVGPS